MGKKLLNVGIAGYGVVGQRRGFYIDRHPNMRVAAVCDKKFSEQDSLEGIQCFENYHQLLKEPLDALFVCLPNYLAPEVTIAGLKQKLHVFCEKPPGRSLSDIKQVIEVERECPGQVLKYGFNHRYHDSVNEAVKLIYSHELGEIINFRGVYGKSKIIPFEGGWRSERKYAGGGILLDQGIHILDLIKFFSGDFVEVKSFVSNQFWGHNVEDNAYAIMRDEYGRVAMVHSSATQWQHRFSLDISLTQGFIVLRGFLSGTKSYGEEELIVGRRDEAHTGATREEVTKYLEDNSWKLEIDEFGSAILESKKIKHGSSMDAFDAMHLVSRIYWSDSEWRDSFDIESPADYEQFRKSK